MENASHGINLERLRRLNNPEFIRTRLTVTYIVIFALAAVIGIALSGYISGILPDGYLARICGLFLPAAAEGFSNTLVYEIIYNSVDIFKISFIILLAGFTYIAAFVNRASAFLTGLLYGIYAPVCLDGILTGAYYGDGASAIALVNITVLRFLLLAAVVVVSSVTSELYADVWKRFRGINSLLSSWQFWKYFIKFLILFGYVILNEVIFRFVINIFV